MISITVDSLALCENLRGYIHVVWLYTVTVTVTVVDDVSGFEVFIFSFIIYFFENFFCSRGWLCMTCYVMYVRVYTHIHVHTHTCVHSTHRTVLVVPVFLNTLKCKITKKYLHVHVYNLVHVRLIVYLLMFF